MKSLITFIVASAALSWPGGVSMSSQETSATQPLVIFPDSEPALEEVAGALAEVQRQVEVELQPGIAAAASGAVELQLTNGRRVIQLAQATPPAAARAVASPGTAPAPVFQQRLQAIVNKGRGGPGKALVIRTSDADAKAQANLEEDLAVMSRILDKTAAKQLEDDQGKRFMGINVLFAPGSGSIRNLYLEGYGALFLLNVNFPLLPPPEKTEPTKEKSETDSTWEEAKQELYGQSDPWSPVGKAFRISMSTDPQPEYDKDKVENLKESLLEALKNATNIRNLKADESITTCVFGAVSVPSGKAKTRVKRAPGSQYAEREEVLVTEHDEGPPLRGTILTIRVKKSDTDAFAKGKLSLEDFRKQASITTYAGDTGGWSGAAVFGAP